jgi:signal transduction histidine kinase/streptogramin lyase
VNVHRARFFLLGMLALLGMVSILFCPALTLPVQAQSTTIRFENISTEQGLSQSTINSIIQDRLGFLWFATEGGLNQYDGYQFTVYHHDPDNPKSISDNVIFSVYEDQKGSLWIGTNSGLDRLDPSSGIFLHYPMDLTDSNARINFPVLAIAQDQSKTLWFGTDGGGLKAMDLTNNRITDYWHDPKNLQSLSSDTVNSIYVNKDGEVWIGTDVGLDRFDRQTGTFTHDLRGALGLMGVDSSPVRAIYEDSLGVMWIGTKGGLMRWDRAANNLVLYQHDPNDPQSISDDSIRNIYEDSLGALWIGTLRGLNQVDKTRMRFINYLHDPNDPYGLSSNYVRSIFEDRSGVLWIGTSDGGLNKFARSTQKFALYNSYPGLPNSLSDNNVWSIYKDQSQNLWIGTFFSGLNKLDFNSGKVTIYQHDSSKPTSLSNNEIRAILQDRNGVLWIGTEHGGLNRYDPTTDAFIHYQHSAEDPASMSADNVFALYTDSQDRLWIGTEFGGLSRFDQGSGKFIHYQHDPNDPLSLSDNGVRSIYQDHTGALWIGTEQGGLNLWDSLTDHFTIFRHNPGDPSSLSNDWVLSILEDKNETLWIGTVGGGLDRFDRSTKSFSHFTVKNGLPDDTIFGVLADTDGNLWLSTNKGLSRFNPTTGSFRNYDVSDGLQGNQFNPGAYFQDQNGDMYFGGTKGLNIFTPQLVKDNPIPPPVVITDLKKFNQTIRTNLAPNEAVQLSYQDNFIAFDFSALDYNAPGKNQYAYILEGVDQDWVHAGTRRYASYTNLQGGNYTFRVKASNNDGVWNEQAATLQINIAPPFWQTWWFIGIVCLSVASLAAGGYWLRIRDIQARNRDLEKRVAQRTHELAVLNTISGVVNRSLDLTAILNAALDETMAVTKMDIGLAYDLTEPDNDTAGGPSLRLLAHRGVSEAYANAIKVMPLRSSLIAKAVETGKPMVHMENTHLELRVREAVEQEGIRMAISLPLMVKGELVGAVSLAARAARPIAPEELSLLDAVGQQVGMAVVNARLYEQAEQTAITAERNRLARELHDSVTQLLYSVTLYAEAATELLASGDTEIAAGHLRDLRDTAQEALREMRLLIFELHRPALGTSGLAAALQARLDAVETRGGIHAELQVDGSEQIALPVQAELYNIAHEALNNVIKHAHADHVRIHLQFGEKETCMEISDDGVGFEPAADGMGGGFGIPGMKERSQKIGGTLQIDSAPGKGTSVIVRTPATLPQNHNRMRSELPLAGKE